MYIMVDNKHWMNDNKLWNICLDKAMFYIATESKYTNLTDPFQIAELLYNAEIEKYERDLKIEKLLDYDDEILEIEEIGDMELMDITVGNDNLFFANDILTKNSSGHAMTADFMIGVISTDELIALGEVRIKQLKNRWGSIHEFSSFLLKMDRKKMRIYQDDDYTRNNPQEIIPKKPDSILPNKSKFDSMRQLK